MKLGRRVIMIVALLIVVTVVAIVLILQFGEANEATPLLPVSTL